jgi:hypothetical protein
VVTAVADLVEAVRELAGFAPSSPALLVRTPSEDYIVSADGLGGAQNRYVISRSQLDELLADNGLKAEDLAEPQTMSAVAALVAAFRPPARRPGEAT